MGLAHWDVEADEHWLSRLEHAAQVSSCMDFVGRLGGQLARSHLHSFYAKHARQESGCLCIAAAGAVRRL